MEIYVLYVEFEGLHDNSAAFFKEDNAQREFINLINEHFETKHETYEAAAQHMGNNWDNWGVRLLSIDIEDWGQE